jgi:hypothetical protein
MKLKFSLIIFLIISNSIFAQEITTIAAGKNLTYKNNRKSKSSIDTLSLPFFDDFSDTAKITKHFSDNFISIDYSAAINPPSIGSAMFDAMDNNNNFYASYNQETKADFLTSYPIKLNYQAKDSIYFSFYYEPGGELDPPENTDSLVLQFFAPKLKKWISVWHAKNYRKIIFKQVNFPITDTAFLHKGFKFRFYNRISMSNNSSPSLVGNCDQWFVDYIYINKNRTFSDTTRRDIAFQYKTKFKIDDYTQIPYSHYKTYSGNYNYNLLIKFKNNDKNIRTIDSMYIVFYDKNKTLQNDTLFLGSYNFLGNRNLNISKKNINFSFPKTDREILTLNMKTVLKTDSYDSTVNNIVEQNKRLGVCYAYDDGTAENGYGLYGTGTMYAYVAQKYFTYKTDKITGLKIYLNKALNNRQSPYFYLKIWNNNPKTGKPDKILYEQAGLEINFNKLNKFQILKLSKPVSVSDTFFIGWEKTVKDIMNIGLDLNSTNINYKYYNINGNWQKSSIPGVMMIRPIFGNTSLANIKNKITSKNIITYPNPVKNQLFFDPNINNITSLEIYDLSGRKIISKTNIYNNSINVNTLKKGIYILKISTSKTIYYSKFIKR